jgi:zinc transporter ZupT
MEIQNLKNRSEIDQNSRLSKKYVQFQKLINELINKKLNDDVVIIINDNINSINSISDLDNQFQKQLKSAQSKILKVIEKHHKLTTENHHRNIWLALGIGAFGVPIGVIIGVITGNMAFIGIGIPIGFSIGIAIGTMKDNKLKDQGKQLALEIKY